MLRRFALVLAAALDVRDERHVDEETVLLSDLQRDLTDRFEKGLRFDIADRASYLRYDDIRTGELAYIIYVFFDLVRYMRDYLHCAAQVVAAPLLVQNVPVDAPRRQVGESVEILIDESFIVSQIQISLSSVIRDEDLAVLVRAHGSRVDVDIWIELLARHFQTSALEEPPQRRCRDPFSESGYDSPCYEYILLHSIHTSVFCFRSSVPFLIFF